MTGNKFLSDIANDCAIKYINVIKRDANYNAISVNMSTFSAKQLSEFYGSEIDSFYFIGNCWEVILKIK